MYKHLENSVVKRIICNARGFTPEGRLFSASLRGNVSPVSKFLTTTASRISCQDLSKTFHILIQFTNSNYSLLLK